MTTQQPEALRLTEIARYCFRSEGMSDPPEQFESPTGDMVDYFDHVEIEKELLARITELESQLAQRFDAADMATAAAQGFLDGVASVSAGSESMASYAIRLLVAAALITQAKADEALRFAEGLTAALGPADGESNV